MLLLLLFFYHGHLLVHSRLLLLLDATSVLLTLASLCVISWSISFIFLTTSCFSSCDLLNTCLLLGWKYVFGIIGSYIKFLFFLLVGSFVVRLGFVLFLLLSFLLLILLLLRTCDAGVFLIQVLVL